MELLIICNWFAAFLRYIIMLLYSELHHVTLRLLILHNIALHLISLHRIALYYYKALHHSEFYCITLH